MSLIIQPTHVLGIKYQGFLNRQKATCLKDPESYVNQRDYLLEIITNNIIDALYTNLQLLLTTGKHPSILKAEYVPNNPQYPPQKINDVIMDVVGQLAEGLNQIVDILCPEAYLKYTDSKLNIQAHGANVGPSAATPTA
jgi:hypothetical protein